MAKIIKANGIETETKPKNGTDFKLEELKEIVGGWVELVWLPLGKIMAVNEDGKNMNLPINEKATKIYREAFAYPDYIVGDVLLCNDEEIL